MSCHVVCMSCGVSCHVFTVRSLKYIFVVLCDACRAMHVVCWMTRHTLYDMEIYVFLQNGSIHRTTYMTRHSDGVSVGVGVSVSVSVECWWYCWY